MAAIWRLPIVFVCENNLYAMSAAMDRFVAGGDIARRAEAYGMPHATIDGNDVEQVRAHARSIVADVRQGAGPFLLECRTYRRLGHSKSDGCAYRTREEEQEWMSRDPIARWRMTLVERGSGPLGATSVGGTARAEARGSQEYRDRLLAAESVLDALAAGVEREIEEAASRALECPAIGPETLFDHLTPRGGPHRSAGLATLDAALPACPAGLATLDTALPTVCEVRPCPA